MYVCMYGCMYFLIYIYIYTHTCIFVCMYVCMYVCGYIHTRSTYNASGQEIGICVCMYTHTHTSFSGGAVSGTSDDKNCGPDNVELWPCNVHYTQTHTHICPCTHTHIHTYIHTYIHTHTPFSGGAISGPSDDKNCGPDNVELWPCNVHYRRTYQDNNPDKLRDCYMNVRGLSQVSFCCCLCIYMYMYV